MPTTKHTKTKEEVDQIAQATAALLLPRLDAIEQLVSNCATKADLNAAKSIAHDRFLLDNIDQYQRRENIRIGGFSPGGDLCTEIIDLLNHMMSVEIPDEPDKKH